MRVKARARVTISAPPRAANSGALVSPTLTRVCDLRHAPHRAHHHQVQHPVHNQQQAHEHRDERGEENAKCPLRPGLCARAGH